MMSSLRPVLLRSLALVALLPACKEGTPAAPPGPKEPPPVAANPRDAAAPAPFAEEIERFERLDANERPAPGGIVFVGSSSIRRWNTLEADMAPLPVLNRGFGGSEFTDAIRYADRIITTYEPAAVVIYSGDNDLARDNGKTPSSVAADFRSLAERIRAKAPLAALYVLSIKPSPARMEQWPKMKEANELLRKACESMDKATFIDVASHLFDASGALRQEAFVEDGIHLSELGYREWTERIRPILGAAPEAP